MSSQCNDHDPVFWMWHFFPDIFCGFKPVHHRHLYIHQDQIIVGFLKGIYCFPAIFNLVELNIQASQYLREKQAIRKNIVNN